MSRRELKDDSGLIDLDALMKQAEAMPRASVPVPAPAPAAMPAPTPTPAPKVARVVAPSARIDAPAAAPARIVAPVRAPAPVLAAPPLPFADDSLTATTHAPAPSSRALPLASTPTSRRRRYGVLAGVLAAGLAALVVARVAHAPGSHAASTTAIAPAAAIAAAPARPLLPATPTLATAAPNGLDPSSLPAAPSESARPALPHAPAPARAAGAPPEPAPAPTAQVTAADLAAVAGKDPGDLGSAMRTAVGPRDEALGTAEANANSGARQLRPSPGAVVGAINSVLPAARACLGPDDAIRKGSLVFRSDGSVARVDLAGTKTEDACVRSALSKARVEAFADDTFTTHVTIRP